MKVSELIKELNEILESEGDLEIICDSDGSPFEYGDFYLSNNEKKLVI